MVRLERQAGGLSTDSVGGSGLGRRPTDQVPTLHHGPGSYAPVFLALTRSIFAKFAPSCGSEILLCFS